MPHMHEDGAALYIRQREKRVPRAMIVRVRQMNKGAAVMVGRAGPPVETVREIDHLPFRDRLAKPRRHPPLSIDGDRDQFVSIGAVLLGK